MSKCAPNKPKYYEFCLATQESCVSESATRVFNVMFGSGLKNTCKKSIITILRIKDNVSVFHSHVHVVLCKEKMKTSTGGKI